MPHPRKRFAQYWLKDASVHQAMVAAAGLDVRAMAGTATVSAEPPCVLEIGPGTGRLTRRLLAAGAKVVAVELDRNLCILLRQQLGQHERLTPIEGDVLTLPLPAEPSLVVANIPYNITSPILEKVLGTPEHPVAQFDRIVLLVQKELADRLSAQPRSKAYSAMSVRCQYLAECETVRTVSRKAFQPSPRVESAIVRLTPRPWPTPVTQPRWLSVLVKQGFATRRKQLANALRSLVDRETLTAALAHMDCNPLSRAEDLSVADWVALSNLLRCPTPDVSPAVLAESARV